MEATCLVISVLLFNRVILDAFGNGAVEDLLEIEVPEEEVPSVTVFEVWLGLASVGTTIKLELELFLNIAGLQEALLADVDRGRLFVADRLALVPVAAMGKRSSGDWPGEIPGL